MSELRESINEMRNMRESYNEIASVVGGITGIEPDITAGKAAIAEAITSKGVDAASTDTLATMAEKVNAISQESYTIDGGEMYAKQLFGSLTTPNYWNLYEVLEMLLSDGRLVSYGGILLAEYYKGYDSLALAGAGAGGAYIVSDKDANGQFIMYTEDTTHTWATDFDGKGNRWVAYCFADEYHNSQITDTNTSPRSIFIGRKVGRITSMVAGRISQIVVPDGNELREFNTGTYAQNWSQHIILQNINNIGNTLLKLNNTPYACVYIQAGTISGVCIESGGSSTQIGSLIIKADIITGRIIGNAVAIGICNDIIVDCEKIALTSFSQPSLFWGNGAAAVKKISFINIESLGGSNVVWSTSSIEYTYFAYKNNDKTRSVGFESQYNNPWPNLTDIELKNGWCKPFSCPRATSLTEANIYSHILQRLKQDEVDCGSGVTITLGATNLAKLTSAESVALLAELRDTYGYTFA